MKHFVVLLLAACGVYSRDIQYGTRIIDGNIASDSNFPWQVALDVNDNVSRGKCGGALISEKVVLTAAHCFEYASVGWASLGSTRYMKGQRISFSNIKIHEQYDGDSISNDIALVYLDAPAKLSDKVEIISIDENAVPENTSVTVSGFGKVTDTVHTNYLYYVSLHTVPLKECIDKYGKLDDTVMCVKGNASESTCTGDSGGPLVRDWPLHPLHVGIVSFGGKSCEEGLPVVYTRTEKYLDWIKKNM